MPREQRRDGIYFIGDHKLPSVTTILGGSIPKPYLVPWAAKMVAKAAKQHPDWSPEKLAQAPNEVRDAGGTRGRAVHDLVEAWAKAVTDGRQLPDDYLLDEEYRGYEKAFRRFIKIYNPQPLYAERVVFNLTHQYAGRLDLIAKVGDQVSLVDFKTSKYVSVEYGLQLAAYANAEHLEVAPGEWKPMVAVDMMAVVLLEPDGTQNFKEVDEPFEVFLAAYELWKWLRTKN